MERQQVIQLEKNKIINQDEDNLVYECQINNKECSLIYGFNNKKLVCAVYYFHIRHVNLNDYIDDYYELQNLLASKYNQPILNEAVWKNNLFQNNRLKYGAAISLGHLIYISKWETEKTNVMLSLTGDNYEVQLSILYSDKNYIPETPATDDL